MFYERTKSKLTVSLVVAAAGLMLLGFCSYSGGMAASFNTQVRKDFRRGFARVSRLFWCIENCFKQFLTISLPKSNFHLVSFFLIDFPTKGQHRYHWWFFWVRCEPASGRVRFCHILLLGGMHSSIRCCHICFSFIMRFCQREENDQSSYRNWKWLCPLFREWEGLIFLQ